MQPITRIPGARLLRDERNQIVFETPNSMKPWKQRPVWQKPDPVLHVWHFKNAAAKAAFNRGDFGDDIRGGQVKVPVYRGMSSSLMRYLAQQFKHKTKLESAKWRKGRKKNEERNAA